MSRTRTCEPYDSVKCDAHTAVCCGADRAAATDRPLSTHVLRDATVQYVRTHTRAVQWHVGRPQVRLTQSWWLPTFRDILRAHYQCGQPYSESHVNPAVTVPPATQERNGWRLQCTGHVGGCAVDLVPLSHWQALRPDLEGLDERTSNRRLTVQSQQPAVHAQLSLSHGDSLSGPPASGCGMPVVASLPVALYRTTARLPTSALRFPRHLAGAATVAGVGAGSTALAKGTLQHRGAHSPLAASADIIWGQAARATVWM